MDPDLPSLNLRNFCSVILQHCPETSQYTSEYHANAFSEFLAYKTRVPVRGAILLNEEMDSVLLVKGWKKGANWSFPRGKINKNESDLDCAIREVYEETGFDIKAAGAVAGQGDDQKFIEITMREQHMRLYVFRGVPMDFEFAPRTRKEISKIQWYKLSDLPTLKKGKAHQDAQTDDLAMNANKYYMVAPFLSHLKKWIGQQKKSEKTNRISSSSTGQVLANATANGTEQKDLRIEMVPQQNLGDMDRLLAGLRQSEQPVASAVELARPQGITPNETSGDLMSFLGLPSSTTMHRESAGLAKGPHAVQTEMLATKKANDLMALLKGAPMHRPELAPETPADQLIQNPLAPPSPKLEHQQAHPHRFPVGPGPRAFPLFSQNNGRHVPYQNSELSMAPSLPHGNQYVSHSSHAAPPLHAAAIHGRPTATPNGPPPGGLPSTAALMHVPSQLSAGTTPQDMQRPPPNSPTIQAPIITQAGVRAPYQRTGDPDFARLADNTAIESRLIPPASKLPPPKLTKHASSLLSLFKAPAPPQELFSAPFEPPVEPKRGQEKTSATLPSELAANLANEESKQASVAPIQQPHISPVNKRTSKTSEQKTQYSKNMHSSQVLQRPSSKNQQPNASSVALLASGKIEKFAGATPTQQTPTTKHQSALLELFRKPSVADTAPKTAPKDPSSSLLLPPSSSFELPALPTTPGRSQNLSGIDQPSNPKQTDDLERSPSWSHDIATKQRQILQRPAQDSAATVDGPLPIPQFELVHHIKEIQNGSARKNRQDKQPVQQGSIKILRRPASKGVEGPPPQVAKGSSARNEDSTSKLASNRNRSNNTPKATETSRASGPKTPQPTFQPQILRRPIQQVADQDLAAPSPVSPLPSPKHPALLSSRGNDTAVHQHKQFLLAMFNQPVSEENKGPARISAPTPLETLGNGSPLATRQQCATDHGARDRTLRAARPDSIASADALENLLPPPTCSSGGSGPITPHRVTPKDRNFLLGYLGDVARSGR